MAQQLNNSIRTHIDYMASVNIYESPKGCDTDDCIDCAQQYLSKDVQTSGKSTYKKQISDSEARAELRHILTRIRKSRALLQLILRQHGDTILSRWRQKSCTWRRKIVLANTPGLTSGNSENEEPSSQASVKPSAKEELLWWPRGLWASGQDEALARDPTLLLSLLKRRSQNSPSSFALSDIKALRAAFGCPGIAPPHYNSKCVSLGEQNYGTLVDWERDLSHSWAIAGFPRAMMMLETQQDILAFLVDIASDIAVRAERRGDTQWLNYKPAVVETSSSLSIWPSSTLSSATYSSPTAFDARSLLRTAQTQLNHACDEIWLCQTDPWYMKREIRERNMLRKTPGDLVWLRLAATFVDKSYSRLGMWYTISEACKKVCVALEQSSSLAGQRLSETADQAMQVLTTELRGYMKSQTYALDSPATRAALREWETACRDAANILLDDSESFDPEYLIGRLANGVAVLQETNGLHDHHGVNVLLTTTISRLKHPRISCRVDRRLYDHIADLAVLNEMSAACKYNQMGHYTPPARSSEPRIFTPVRRPTAEAKQITKEMGMLLKTFYNTPLPSGRKNLAWWDAVKQCRLQLAQFWDSGRSKIIILSTAHEEIPQAVVNWFSFDSSPEFLAHLNKERQACKVITDSDARAQRAAKENRLIREPLAPWGDFNEEAHPVRRRKTKAKARQGITMETIPIPASLTSVSNDLPENEVALIYVNEDSRVVFTKMYSATVDNGDISWQRFVKAMVDAGCSVREAAGSAVTFSFGPGCVSVHKKHPDPTVDAIMLHAIGRRLRKWFGWNEERFVVRKKA